MHPVSQPLPLNQRKAILWASGAIGFVLSVTLVIWALTHQRPPNAPPATHGFDYFMDVWYMRCAFLGYAAWIAVRWRKLRSRAELSANFVWLAAIGVMAAPTFFSKDSGIAVALQDCGELLLCALILITVRAARSRSAAA